MLVGKYEVWVGGHYKGLLKIIKTKVFALYRANIFCGRFCICVFYCENVSFSNEILHRHVASVRYVILFET